MRISLGRFKKTYDIAVVGAGAAGISAAINGKAAMKEVVVFESEQPMGKLRKAKEIRNYPGIPRATGEELSQAFLSHLREMGIELRKEKVTGVVRERDFVIYTQGGKVRAKAVILAVGLRREEVIPGEEKLLGRGVSYCVVCDGAAYGGGRVAVISDSDEGEREAEALKTCYGCEVTYIPLYGMRDFKRSYRVLHERPVALVPRGEGVEVLFEDGSLRVDGVFVLKQFTSPRRLVRGLKMRDNHIAVDGDMQTSVPGVFAAGDCTGSPFKIAKAVGEGQVAALSAIRYLSHRDPEEMEVVQ